MEHLLQNLVRLDSTRLRGGGAYDETHVPTATGIEGGFFRAAYDEKRGFVFTIIGGSGFE